ncbi:MAG: DUF1330 domain-containing protein [Proteobacteria bacterium]|nr:DUF1330 domain-containing protein [Pseudomonadota bacterium]
MAKGYWVSVYRKVHDADKLAAYARLAMPALEAQGGRFLVRGIPAEVKENGLKERTVVVEFPSLDAALAAHASPQYAEALAALDGAVEREIRIIEGFEQ